jgi:hypothetical protein
MNNSTQQDVVLLINDKARVECLIHGHKRVAHPALPNRGICSACETVAGTKLTFKGSK